MQAVNHHNVRRERKKDALGFRQWPRRGESEGLSRPLLAESTLQSRLCKKGLEALSTRDFGSKSSMDPRRPAMSFSGQPTARAGGAQGDVSTGAGSERVRGALDLDLDC